MRDEDLLRNRLLTMLDLEAREQLAPLVPVRLNAREILKEPGMPAIHAYFPLTTVVSLVTTMESGASAEVALIGHEGMIGLAGVLGAVETLTSAVVQVSGLAIRISTGALRAARLSNPSVRNTLDLYTQARFVQVAQTAACARLHPVDARLARWLLAIHDRIDGDEFIVSQEFMADMLGVHRPTVSTALQRLQEHGAIARRGRTIVIAARQLLEAQACECYRVVDREFERLLTPHVARPEPPSSTSVNSFVSTHGDASLETMREIAGRLLVVSIREQEAREQAEEANRAKDHFLATVSHELRNPLNVILGWCATLTAHKDRPPDHGLDIIARHARAQLALVEELLDAARVTSSTLTIQPLPISFSELVHQVVEAITPAADEKHVTLWVTDADAPLSVFGDADRLRQVVLNILTNSLKFTDGGGSIDVHLQSCAGRAQLIVRDTGKGIAPTTLPHVFERFRQGTPSDVSRQGLGLGLTIARALVELHGGAITLESPGENQGTTCTIELPLFDQLQTQSPDARPFGNDK
jgi:signal transduction histidine kinase